MRILRTFALLPAMAAALALAGGSGAAGLTNAKHFFWAAGQSPQGTANSLSNDLIYHGGNLGDGAIGIEKTPAVYLVYWGPQWAAGFTTPDSATGTLYSS